MTEETRNTFISHIHEDDSGIDAIKNLAQTQGMVVRNGSVTAESPNDATNAEYIKYQILAPRIRWSSVLVVYVSPDTKNSWWVNWEIEYAQRLGKRIVGVWERGAADCELPVALDRYADAVVGWNGNSIVDAINGKSDDWKNPSGQKWEYRDITRYSCN